MGVTWMVLSDVHVKADAPGRAEMLRKAVALACERRVDVVVNLGDLVSTGIDREYELAREILAPLPDVIHVVGNHELQVGSLLDFRRHLGQVDGAAGGVTVLCSGQLAGERDK
jgi:3',5'-cyclic AMP phosphodiesterase CpdA